jgi:hypothetical protein
MTIFIKNDVSRRSGIERKVFSYILFIPERRSGKERRGGLDRRSGMSFKFPLVFEQVPFFQDWDNT